MGNLKSRLEQIVKLNEKFGKLANNTTYDSIKADKTTTYLRTSMTQPDFKQLKKNLTGKETGEQEDIWYFAVDDRLFVTNIYYESKRTTNINSAKQVKDICSELAELVSTEFPVITLEGRTITLDKVAVPQQTMSQICQEPLREQNNGFLTDYDGVLINIIFNGG